MTLKEPSTTEYGENVNDISYARVANLKNVLKENLEDGAQESKLDAIGDDVELDAKETFDEELKLSIDESLEDDIGIEYLDLSKEETTRPIFEEHEQDLPSNRRGGDRIHHVNRLIRELLVYILIIVAAVFAAIFLVNFVFFNSNVPSSSMEPTVSAGDNLLSLRTAYLFEKPKRGDMIIFRYPDDESQVFLKRIIGEPGDKIEILDGIVFINGRYYEENYLKEEMLGDYGPVTVPEDCYFVMGDNRNRSEDSRYWDNPFVRRDAILARAWLRYQPNWSLIWDR